MDHERKRMPSYRNSRRFISNKIATNRRRRADTSITTEEVMDMLNAQDGLCAITGLMMTWNENSPHTNISIDRIDTEVGYQIDNIRLVCATVNYMRHRMSDEQLVFWCRAVIEGLDAG